MSWQTGNVDSMTSERLRWIISLTLYLDSHSLRTFHFMTVLSFDSCSLSMKYRFVVGLGAGVFISNLEGAFKKA